MSGRRILIAGVGNIFFGDDAFGSVVAGRLTERRLPAGVRVADFGIRGMDLMYALLEDHDAVILIDTVRRGHPPGTVYVLEPELPGAEPVLETHAMDPLRVLAAARAMGARPGRVLLVGCEPERVGWSEDGQIGLSRPVQGAVDGALRTVASLVEEALS